MESIINLLNETAGQSNGLPMDSRLPKLISDEDFTIVVMVVLGVGLTLSLFGILTNVINIRTFVKIGVEDGVTCLFLIISCTDLAFVVLTAIRNVTAMMHTMEKDEQVWLLPVDPLVVAFFADNSASVVYTTTTLISTLLGVARCMCVAKPLHFRHTFTRRRCVVASVLCFLLPAACQIAVFANMGTRQRFDASQNRSRLAIWMSSDRERVKDIGRLITNFILVIAAQIISVICVVILSIKLWQAAQFRNTQKPANGQGSSSTKLTGKDLQAVKQVVIIVFIFVVLNVLKLIESFMATFDDRLDIGKQYQNLYDFMNHFGTVFRSLNATVNILVYLTYNSKFRSACAFW